MIDRSEEIASAAARAEAAQSRLVPQLMLLARTLATSPLGHTLISLLACTFVVVAATAYTQILLNRWNQPFYDALSRRDMADFLRQLGVFGLIAGTLLVLNVAQRWLGETLKLRLREALVGDLLEAWLMPRRAFWLASSGTMGVNPDQRMHEDARKLCELSADLGIGLLQASILLVTFIGVLWVLSSRFTLHLGGRDLAIPGYMVWSAMLYAGTGSALSYWVGRGLIHRNAERYAREADMRSTLVRVNEHLDGIALAAGEADERRRVQLDLTAVLAATRRLVTGITSLEWVTAGFGWITLVAPILVAAPMYFGGALSFGGMMMAAAAFTQAQSSLRWFIDNFRNIADWRATLLRVASFQRALLTTDMEHRSGSRITYAEGEPALLTIERLEVESLGGSEMLKERHVEMRAGERILVVGERGTSKTQLFRALAGLWPWGAGRIIRPPGEPILYFPRGTPYLPRGTLEEVLAYPLAVDSFGPGAYAHALARLGLGRLEPLLKETRRWDRELTEDEQLSLAFARVLLHAPAWLIIDDTFGALERETLEHVIDVFGHELEHTGVIHLGSAETRDPLRSRVVHLVKCPPGQPAALASECASPGPLRHYSRTPRAPT
jgi:vitamin B12/bleomycin/antimicrobial peptide transport system ATP-binding/permease protein